MASEVIPFEFEGHGVRVVERDGEPWWVLADVCGVLEHSNPSHAATRLDEDEKLTLTNSEGHGGPGIPQQLTLINESGLYSLILTSRKPAAKRFKKWVTAEVLPTIRRTGSYVAQNAPLPEVWRREIAHLIGAAVAETMSRLVPALSKSAAIAKEEEFRPARVLEDGITVRELVARLGPPALVNRRSLSGSLTARLISHFAQTGHPVQLRCGLRYFPRIASCELRVGAAMAWRAARRCQARPAAGRVEAGRRAGGNQAYRGGASGAGSIGSSLRGVACQRPAPVQGAPPTGRRLFGRYAAATATTSCAPCCPWSATDAARVTTGRSSRTCLRTRSHDFTVAVAGRSTIVAGPRSAQNARRPKG